jgi:hypothetical protein
MVEDEELEAIARRVKRPQVHLPTILRYLKRAE